MKNVTMEFTNMKATRVGNGIRIRHERLNMSLAQLSKKTEIPESYLRRLEEGCEPLVESEVLLRIATALGMRGRGNPTIDDLVNFFLCVPENANRQLTFI